MAALSLTYSLSNGTTADAAQVQQNLTDIKNYVNNSVIRTDGANAMAAALTLSGDPTSASDAVRKTYMDGAYVAVTTAGSATYGTGAGGTVIKYGTVVRDTVNGSSTSNYSAATGLFTAPRTGVYHVAFAIDAPSPDIHIYRGWIRRAGSASNDYSVASWVPSGIVSGTSLTTSTLGGSIAIYVASGDTIGCYLQAYGGSATFTGNGWATFAWLHA